MAYFVTDNFHMFAVDANTGSLQWKTRIIEPGDILSTCPVQWRKMIIGGTKCGVLYAIDQDTGKKNWQIFVEDQVDGRPVIDRDIAFVQTIKFDDYFSGEVDYMTTAIHAIDCSSGKSLWVNELKKRISSNVTIKDGIAYFLTYDENQRGERDFHIGALDIKSGSMKWSRKISDYAAKIVLDEKNIYFSCHDMHIYAIDLLNGNQKWTVEIKNSSILGNSFLSNSFLYCIGDGKVLYKIDPSNGQINNEYYLDAEEARLKLTDGEQAYFIEKNKSLFSINLKEL
jgi:outer membrane protein assembly factor BamB